MLTVRSAPAGPVNALSWSEYGASVAFEHGVELSARAAPVAAAHSAMTTSAMDIIAFRASFPFFRSRSIPPPFRRLAGGGRGVRRGAEPGAAEARGGR